MVRPFTENLNQYEKELLSNIEQHGWQVTSVFGDKDDPSFVYSIGIYASYGQPDFLVVGLDAKPAAELVNLYGAKIKEGTTPFEAGHFYSDFLEGHDVYMTEANTEAKAKYTLSCKWYYEGTDFPLLQCVWPSIKGFWPWDANAWEDYKAKQPIFGKTPEPKANR